MPVLDSEGNIQSIIHLVQDDLGQAILNMDSCDTEPDFLLISSSNTHTSQIPAPEIVSDEDSGNNDDDECTDDDDSESSKEEGN